MITHFIAGPDTHGVTEYALLLAEYTGGEVVRFEGATTLPDAPVHVTFTDHIFGPNPDAAVDAVLKTVGDRPLSVSFHDVPQPAEGADRFARRSAAYRRLAHRAELVVTNSHHEARFFDHAEAIHLPLPEAPDLDVVAEEDLIGILGFIYPGKGHQEVADAVAQVGGYRIVNLGGYSPGHEDLGFQGVEVTGYLADDDLWKEMARVAVPICAHRHVSASGSLMRWLAAGRKVLVAPSTYAEEMAEAFPEQVHIYTDLERTLRELDVRDFAQPVAHTRRHGWEEVAWSWIKLWARTFSPWLSGNQPHAPGAPGGISVLIPHYNNDKALQRVVDAVEVAAARVECEVEIIVGDDGSTHPPAPRVSLPLTVLSQEDRGFRAAAARNLAASAARHEVLCFLDADTVPEPDYLAHAAGWVATNPRAVVVGTRLQDGVEPQWLREAWQHSDNLRFADDTSWRFVISSVLTVGREFFCSLGGFDASMVGYGGEDWEFGFRAWNRGAMFIHEPCAVAHHLEPEWAEREGDKTAEKNAESLALATRISHPLARPEGIIVADAEISVRLPENTPEQIVAEWIHAGDVRVTGPASALFDSDPRVGPVPAHPRARIELTTPAHPPQELTQVLEVVEKLGGIAEICVHRKVIGGVEMRRREAGHHPCRIVVEKATDLPRLERWFAGW